MKKWKKVLIIILVIVLIAGIAGTVFFFRNKNKKSAGTVSDLAVVRVSRGDITLSISSTGVLTPYERYDIVPLVKGKIISSPYEEGDMVSKDAVLYSIDDSDMLISLDKTKNSIDKKAVSSRQNDENIANLTIYAKEDGYVSGLDVKTGDNVQGAKLGNIINDTVLKVSIPFTKNQVDKMYVGERASIVSATYMSYIDATVSDISNQPTPSGNGVFYMVEFEVNNPGSLKKGMSVTAVVDGMTSPSNGLLENASEITITAETNGKVKEVYVKNGDFVKKGAKLIQLENETYTINAETNALDMRDLELSLESQQKQLKDYYITSPISGTVVEKTYKAGDTINNANSSVILMTVADLSKLKFTMDVDELDISKLEIGQDVVVTADAVENQTFAGKITKIATEGTSQNGVATYKVEVVIDEPGALRPSMNVDAQIIIQNRTNVVRVAATDITTIGTKSFVTVKSDGESNKSERTNVNGQMQNRPDNAEGMPGRERAERQQNGSDETQNTERGQWAERERQNNTSDRSTADQTGNYGNRTSSTASSNSGVPEGFELREVVVGVSNTSYVEIVEGLNEGDEILSLSRATNPDSNTGLAAMMGGGMMGGGMMGGGMPGGGMPNNGGGAPNNGGNRR